MDRFWPLFEKYKRGFERYPHRVTLGSAPHLRECLCELDARFLDEVGLPMPEHLLGGIHYFTPGAFYEGHLWAGKFLGLLGVWPLIHERGDQVLVVRADLGKTFYHANCVAHAVFLPIMIEETLLAVERIPSDREDGSRRGNKEVLRLFADLESDIQALDPRVLTEECFWPHELHRAGCDFGVPAPAFIQQLPQDEETLF